MTIIPFLILLAGGVALFTGLVKKDRTATIFGLVLLTLFVIFIVALGSALGRM